MVVDKVDMLKDGVVMVVELIDFGVVSGMLEKLVVVLNV